MAVDNSCFNHPVLWHRSDGVQSLRIALVSVLFEWYHVPLSRLFVKIYPSSFAILEALADSSTMMYRCFLCVEFDTESFIYNIASINQENQRFCNITMLNACLDRIVSKSLQLIAVIANDNFEINPKVIHLYDLI